MSEDISRHLFQPDKRYSGVRMQQGRVILDSDWNESERIQAEQARRILSETIGKAGTPNEGFLVKDVELSGTSYNFKLAAGSFYLGGQRFEISGNEFESFLDQSDWLQIDADPGNLPKPPPTDVQGDSSRIDLVYLIGCEQIVTAVEDRELREPALGGPDSSTRRRLMRRIAVLPDLDLEPGAANCESAFAALKQHITLPQPGDVSGRPHIFDDSTLELRSKATLTVSCSGQGPADDPCQSEAGTGFLGAENQTIRVQLTATNRFIWGYDNASPLYRVQVVEGEPDKIKFLTLPRDQAAHPLRDEAVEILRWGALLPNVEKVAELQGHLTTVASSFDPDEKTLTLARPVPQKWISWLDDSAHAHYLSKRDPDGEQKYFYLRLWTGGSGKAQQPDHAFTVGTPVELAGTGLSVTFSANGLPGDYWIIAARPNTPDLVAPWELFKGASPAGSRFFYAPLAVIGWGNTDGKIVPSVTDCRDKFQPRSTIKVWELNGNSGTSPGNDFLGTTDAQPLILKTNGEERMRIDSNGNVGIGTDNPGRFALTIRATDSSEEIFSFLDPSGRARWHINQNLGGNTPGLNFVETGVADGRLFIQAGGNVGIGTTTPGSKLSVAGVLEAERIEATSDVQEPLVGVLSARNQGKGIALLAHSVEGLAGSFLGNVSVVGELSVLGTLFKSQGAFRIDHPLDPENKYLCHFFVESSDMKNLYDGVVVLDPNGEGNVELPAWFEALNGDFRYQLTAIGKPAPSLHIATELENNGFKIAGGNPGMKVAWQVTGIRQDPFAQANPIAVEQDKPAEMRGTYLHPEAHGQPQEKGAMFLQSQKAMRQ